MFSTEELFGMRENNDISLNSNTYWDGHMSDLSLWADTPLEQYPYPIVVNPITSHGIWQWVYG